MRGNRPSRMVQPRAQARHCEDANASLTVVMEDGTDRES